MKRRRAKAKVKAKKTKKAPRARGKAKKPRRQSLPEALDAQGAVHRDKFTLDAAAARGVHIDYGAGDVAREDSRRVALAAAAHALLEHALKMASDARSALVDASAGSDDLRAVAAAAGVVTACSVATELARAKLCELRGV